MNDLGLLEWSLVFAAGALVLVRAGIALAKNGDEIATRTGLGHMLVGMLLVAAATSLPEIVTDVSAALEDAPDIAVGDLFGSSMANMAILAVIDLVHRRHVWRVVDLGHARTASIAIALTALAVLGVATPTGVRLGWIGLDTLLIGGGYVAAVAWVRRAPRPAFARVRATEFPRPTEWSEAEDHRAPLRNAVRRFAFAAAAILVAGPVVARAGSGIAETSGADATFVGVALVALATSLPELVASLGALRIGAYDLAVGNLFGSNAINMAVLLLVDVAYLDGPVLSAADPSQVIAGVGAIGLMAVALAAIVHGEETRVGRLEPDAIVLLLGYVGALLAIWLA